MAVLQDLQTRPPTLTMATLPAGGRAFFLQLLAVEVRVGVLDCQF
jgi:hypothetical protein